MTQNKRNTKRALLTSVLSLTVCVAMLIGSTYAWFTDSATTGVNKIVAGNLDVKLEYATAFDTDGKVTTWTEVNEDTKLFSDVESGETENLWEPGHTEVVYLKISNVGSLALKYQLAVTVANETTSINVNDETLKLSDHLVFGQIENVQTKYATREAAWQAAGDTKGLSDYTKESSLEAGADSAHYVALVVYMPTSVGNEANHKTGEVVPSIDLGVNLLATQYTSESDSFGNLYDEGALYDNEKKVTTSVELNNALKEVEAGDKVYMPAGTFELTENILEGVSLIGEGTDETVITVDGTDNGNKGFAITEDNVTISNLTLAGKNITGDYSYVVKVEADGTVIDNVVVIGGSGHTWASSIYIQKLGVDSTVTIKDTVISGAFRGILRESCSANIVVDNCDIDAVYPISVDGNYAESTLVVKNSKLHGWTSYSKGMKVTFENTEFTKANSGYNCVAAYADTTFIDCTFSSDFQVYAQVTGFDWTFTNCKKDGNLITADNISTMFEDSDVWNKCQCTVNAVLVQ